MVVRLLPSGRGGFVNQLMDFEELLMRRLPILAAALAFSVPAVALDMPARKAGLWEMKMVFEGRRCRRRSCSTASMPRPTSR